ncbi:3953_t:CDS:2, partial [Ambispora gerdemannii]
SEYQRIEYDSQLKSNNYQLFGNVVTCNGEKLENVCVKFSMKTKFGFSVIWHDFRQNYIQADDKSTFDSAKTPYKLRWILIGCPSEIGYSNSNTHDISADVRTEELKLTRDPESVKIDVGQSLFLRNIVAYDIEYASLPTSLFFEVNIKNWQESGSIEIEIKSIKEEDEEDVILIDEDEDLTITIRWCVLSFKNNSEITIWNQLGKLGEFLESDNNLSFY